MGKPRDLIDYQILISEEILNISVLDKNHEIHNISIEKDQDVNLELILKMHYLIQSSNVIINVHFVL